MSLGERGTVVFIHRRVGLEKRCRDNTVNKPRGELLEDGRNWIHDQKGGDKEMKNNNEKRNTETGEENTIRLCSKKGDESRQIKKTYKGN